MENNKSHAAIFHTKLFKNTYNLGSNHKFMTQAWKHTFIHVAMNFYL